MKAARILELMNGRVLIRDDTNAIYLIGYKNLQLEYIREYSLYENTKNNRAGILK